MRVALVHREYFIRLLRCDETTLDSETSSRYSLAGLVYVPFCPGSVLLLPVSEELLSIVLLGDAVGVTSTGFCLSLD